MLPASESARLFEEYQAWALRIARLWCQKRGIAGLWCQKRGIAGLWCQKRGIAGLDQDDLANGALAGLWEASLKFDPARGLRFKTLAGTMIVARIGDAARRLDPLPRLMRIRVKKGEIEAPKIALLSSLVQMAERMSARPRSWKDPKGHRAMELLEAKDQAGRLMRKLFGLQRRVIEGMYLEEKTMKEIGQELGLSESRICQIHQLAIEHLRRSLGLPEGTGIRATRARGQRRLARPSMES